MKLTNNSNLPRAIVKAIENDTYNKGECDYSITELLRPPRQAALQIKHKDEIEEDAADRIWSLVGQVGHTILERAAIKNDITEKRLFSKFGDTVVSGQIDSLSLENGRLTDWKFTTAWAFKGSNLNDKPEWEQQLNMQYFLLLMNNYRNVENLQICAILRDWSKLEARRNPDYPQKGVIIVPIKMWGVNKCIDFFRGRISAHEEARNVKLPECTKEERWAKDTKWALMVKGKTKANKLFNERAGCELALDYVKDSYMEERPGANTRCESYCLASKFCEQYKKMKD